MLLLFFFFVTVQNPTAYIRKNSQQSCLSLLRSLPFAHIWGGSSIRAASKIG